MTRRRTVLERAYDLARSGDCAGVPDIRARLKAEGYAPSDVRDQLYGRTVTIALQRLCLATQNG